MRTFAKTRALKTALLILAAAGILASVITAVAPGALQLKFPGREDTRFNQDWEYIDENEKTNKIELPYIIKGYDIEQVTISKTLPQEPQEDWTLALYAYSQGLRVTVEGQTLLDYNAADNPYFQAPPSAWQLAPLTADMAGKTVAVTYEMPYAVRSKMLPESFIGSMEQCLVSIQMQDSLNFIANLLVLITSILIFVFALIFAGSSKQRNLLAYLGLFGLFAALWLFSGSRSVQFYVENLYVMTVCFLLFRICMSIAMLLFVRQVINEFYPHNYLSVLLYAFVALLPLVGILQIFFVCDCTCLTIPVQLLTIITIGEVIRSVVLSMGKESYLQAGLPLSIILLFTYGLEFVRYFSRFYTSMTTVLIPALILGILTAIWIVVLRTIFMHVEETNEMREQIMEGRVQLMLSQIKPHFIYNALNSIRILIKKDPDTACDMVTNFSAYLRSNMNAMGTKKLAAFTEELDHIRAYVEIEKVRFPNIDVVFEIDEANFNIPVLTVEPLVENAIKHGVARARGGGIVTIRAFQSGRYIYIEVKDNGVGFDIRQLGRENDLSIGLKNVKYRLVSMMDGVLTIQSEPGKGTVARIKLPAERAKGGETLENNFG